MLQIDRMMDWRRQRSEEKQVNVVLAKCGSLLRLQLLSFGTSTCMEEDVSRDDFESWMPAETCTHSGVPSSAVVRSLSIT
jgi:hypothetical protein